MINFIYVDKLIISLLNIFKYSVYHIVSIFNILAMVQIRLLLLDKIKIASILFNNTL